ncbi:PH domain-containing protein [Opitutus terrae]|uniref:Membrane-flanked domain n=1 Tax=Opitutus terrae (strain DSM 11246 / JCM 15787 / PB90-1) TaxID=452637 RepID=B1ZTG8_OPITP|nr:PH domain-containing protein [Opitutus terrae]ACB73913.1 membrane-flanked domain [Opitutus terrae PB90-1]
MHPASDAAAILSIERPHPSLLTYYLLAAAVIPPLFPIVALPLYFRYHTMRYRFTEEGISMRWGILFRREVIIHYARIQDIHLRSNLVERWLGLARVLVQTASGNAAAEMTLEGLREFEAVRDFLYSRMRGVKEHALPSHGPSAAAATGTAIPAGTEPALAATLREIAAELRAMRTALAARETREAPSDGHHHA